MGCSNLKASNSMLCQNSTNSIIDFADSGQLAGCIEEVLRDESIFARVLRDSYFHRNGFTKIVLRRIEASGQSLRVHIWNPEKSLDTDIHNHAWNFVSYIVSGTLFNDEYEETGMGGGWHRHIFPTLHSSSTCVSYDGRRSLKLLRRSVINPRQAYAMNSSVLHRVGVIGNETAVSVVFQGPAVAMDTTVLSRNRLEGMDVARVSRLERPQLVAHLAHLDSIL